MHLAEMELGIQSASGAPNWYALFTRHQHEKAVAFALSNKSHEVYLPLYRSVHRWQDRAKALWLPLFPCYVFIREGMDSQLQIFTPTGAIHIVRWGGRLGILARFRKQGRDFLLLRFAQEQTRSGLRPSLGAAEDCCLLSAKIQPLYFQGHTLGYTEASNMFSTVRDTLGGHLCHLMQFAPARNVGTSLI